MIDSILTSINGRFEQGKPTIDRWCVTGEEYTYFSHNGKTKKEAENSFLSAFDEYAKDKNGKIYWRKEPSIEKNESGVFCVTARLIISDKQPMRS